MSIVRFTYCTAALLALTLVAAACGNSSDTTAGTTAADPGATVETTTDDPSTEPDTSETAGPGDVVDLIEASELCPTEGEEWEVAKLYIEHNATDEDTGVHGVFGGEAWKALCIWDPEGIQIVGVHPMAQLLDLTISDFVFESREPPADEFSVQDLITAFPAGDYRVSGTDYAGVARVGSATFTHDIPVEPEITSPTLVEEPEEARSAPVAPAEMTITWNPVTETLTGAPLDITAYEVIVTTEEYDDPNGLSRPVYDVHVGPDVTELAVPNGFLQPQTVYELEVLALEVSGNQTISVGFFATS